MDIEIREMQISDYDSIRSLWESIPGLKLEAADSKDGIAKYLKRNPKLSYVAIKNDQVIGTVLGGEDGRRGYLQHLCVVEKHRNTGIATKLLDIVMHNFELLGLNEVRIFVFKNNKIANSYWKNRDWLIRDDIFVRSFIMPKQKLEM